MSTANQFFKTCSAAGLLMLLSFTTALAIIRDTSLNAEIRREVQNGELNNKLYYPASVARFYTKSGYRAAWIKPQGGMGHAWQAMLMIDCVLQFGLSNKDYHPKDLTYDGLHAILDTPGKVSLQTEARYELLLTDALLTLMNNLHYGKLNPDYAPSRIDHEAVLPFSAGDILLAGLRGSDILPVVAGVQPKAKAYTQLQYRMHLLEGVYQDDCYEVPQAEVRKIAINMERLRWAETPDSVYMQINIPTYRLKLFLKDTIRQFKVIVGKPATPTPTLQSEIRYLTTAPEWKVPAKIFRKEILVKALADTAYLETNHFAIYDTQGRYVEHDRANLLRIQKTPGNYFARQSAGCDNALGLVVFRFPNLYNVYLHDTPEQQLFKRSARAFSHGCIRVEKAEELAVLLLQQDGSSSKIPSLRDGMHHYVTRTINLNKPMPLRITYLTCGIGKWGLVSYPDIYDLDERLEMAMYGADAILNAKTK
jgi:hypothetical protein